MSLKAHIADDIERAGIKVVFVVQSEHGPRSIYAPGGDTIAVLSGGVTPNLEPLRLRDDEARVLHEALGRYLGGTDDTRALRKDYDAERARVDKLVDALITRQAQHG